MKQGSFSHRALRVGMVLLGAIVGLLIGFYTTLAIVVAKARFDYYIFALHDLASVRFETLPILLGLLLGGFLAYKRPRRYWRALLRGLVGLIVGVGLGILLGLLIWGSSEGMYAGAIVVSALALLGVMGLSLQRFQRTSFTRTDFAAAGVVVTVVVITIILGLRDPEAVEVPEIDPAPLPAAAEVEEVVFLVGDAGATKTDRTPLLVALQHDIERWSEALAREAAVSVVFPGDLVYPVGVRDRDHPLFPQDSSRLWNQIELVGGPQARRYGSLGLLVPGNHDWGNTSRLDGLDRIRNLGEQIEIAQERGIAVSLVPEDGAPGPVVRDVREDVRFVFFDGHWFLRERSSALREAFLEEMEEALASAGDRHVIMVSHHPYQSAGPHGAIVPGFHSWGVGYLMRRSGSIVQDLNSPVYEELLNGMRRIFESVDRPPLIFVGGHDHSLQVIERKNESDPAYMLVSGAGSKISSIRTLPNMHYGAGRPGYMKLLFRKDGAVDLFVVAGDPELLKCEGETDEAVAACMVTGANSFDITYGKTIAAAPEQPMLTDSTAAIAGAPDPDGGATVVNVVDRVPPEPAPSQKAYAWWTLDYIPATAEVAEADETLEIPGPAVPARVLYFQPDSVLTTPGASYLAGLAHRLVLGDLNRHLWDVPVRLPVLDLDELGGGVEVEELTGGMQTVGIKLEGSNGITYQFRNIVKIGTRALGSEMEKKTIGEILEDQLGSQFPFGAMVAAELAEAAGLLVAKPRPVVMPNDDRLGPYRPYFAGRVGWIEVRPNELDDDRPGFAGSRKIVGGPSIYEKLREDPAAYADARKFLRARLLDFLIGDWDRHSDNWRWARFDDPDGRARWEPIPRDRDWAFTRSDGLAASISPLVFPRYVGFSDEINELPRLAASGYRLDHRILSGLPREAFAAEARRLQEMLPDEMLAAALAVLPAPYQTLEAPRLLQELKSRRGQLVSAAEAFHDLLAETVHVHGYDDRVDTVRLEVLDADRLRVRAWTEGADEPFFDRTMDRALTKEIRLYLDSMTDVVEQDEAFPALVTLAPVGEQDDEERDY